MSNFAHLKLDARLQVHALLPHGGGTSAISQLRRRIPTAWEIAGHLIPRMWNRNEAKRRESVPVTKSRSPIVNRIMRVRHQTDNVEAIVAATIEAMEAVKGKEIVTLDLREITTAVTDYFVICHAPSKTQVDAIADKVEELVFEKTHSKPYHVEGRDNTEWILIDFVDVVVHVFLESARGYYKLEELWADAERIVKATEE